jgi:predicted lipoprotein with Yx(FWY)xxD motif
MTLRTASALAALAATLLVAGCGGSDNDTGTAASAPTTAPAYDYGAAPAKTPEAAAPSEDAATIKAASGALGAMLVDAEGRSLYLWEADQGAKSACDGPCAEAWPPVTTVGDPKAGDGVDAKLLGTTKRADGTLAVTYNGHPLYYFGGDAEAGQANGQGSNGFGAPWWVVSPKGEAIEA